jgi:hypothetical protein
MTNRKEYAAKPATTPGPWHTRAGMSGVQICNDAGVCVARTPCFDRQAQADGAVLIIDALEGVRQSASHRGSAAQGGGNGSEPCGHRGWVS